MVRPRKKYTVRDLQLLKGKRVLTHIHVKSPQEAAAAEAAGIDLISCSFDSPEAQARLPQLVAAAPNSFLSDSTPHGMATQEEALRTGFRALEMGASSVYCSGSPFLIEAMAREGIPVVGHIGMVPRHVTWTNYRSIGKTVEEAKAIHGKMKDLENARAYAAEIEIVPHNLAPLDRGYRDPSAVYLSLGQAAEGRKRFDEAISWYRCVEAADWVRAQLKIATLIAKQQGLDAGREYLQRIEPRSSEDRIQKIQVEAQLLREAKAWRDTYEMLLKALEEFPDSFELLYDRAMAAERIDRLDVLETDLRRVIEMKPDYAHAYNALGYTLAEKTDRLEEARALIEKAVKLAPDDPFIQDSLGWVSL